MRALRHLLRPKRVEPDLPPVSQPAPLLAPQRVSPGLEMVVLELSELEARALCAREDIPVFWPRRDTSGTD